MLSDSVPRGRDAPTFVQPQFQGRADHRQRSDRQGREVDQSLDCDKRVRRALASTDIIVDFLVPPMTAPLHRTSPYRPFSERSINPCASTTLAPSQPTRSNETRIFNATGACRVSWGRSGPVKPPPRFPHIFTLSLNHLSLTAPNVPCPTFRTFVASEAVRATSSRSTTKQVCRCTDRRERLLLSPRRPLDSSAQ